MPSAHSQLDIPSMFDGNLTTCTQPRETTGKELLLSIPTELHTSVNNTFVLLAVHTDTPSLKNLDVFTSEIASGLGVSKLCKLLQCHKIIDNAIICDLHCHCWDTCNYIIVRKHLQVPVSICEFGFFIT